MKAMKGMGVGGGDVIERERMEREKEIRRGGGLKGGTEKGTKPGS